MFDIQIAANVKSIKVKVKQSKGGVFMRTCTVVLEREFDDAIAAGLGGDARKALSALRSGGMKSCVLPMTAVDASAQLLAQQESCDIGELVGVKATGVADDSEDDFPPSVLLEFDFAWSEAAWVFLGKNCGGLAVIELKKRQQELDILDGGVKSIRMKVGDKAVEEIDLGKARG